MMSDNLPDLVARAKKQARRLPARRPSGNDSLDMAILIQDFQRLARADAEALAIGQASANPGKLPSPKRGL